MYGLVVPKEGSGMRWLGDEAKRYIFLIVESTRESGLRWHGLSSM